MRIIAGRFGGRIIKTPRGGKTRPTLAQVKESIFNILSNHVEDAHVLDLFAGSGSLGLEAVSRGANDVTFVDRDRSSISVIKDNVDMLELSETTDTLHKSVYAAIRLLAEQSRLFHIIFADPPYEKGHEDKLLQRINEFPIVSDSGIVVIEHSCRTETPEFHGSLHRRMLRAYGDTHVSFYQSK